MGSHPRAHTADMPDAFLQYSWDEDLVGTGLTYSYSCSEIQTVRIISFSRVRGTKHSPILAASC